MNIHSTPFIFCLTDRFSGDYSRLSLVSQNRTLEVCCSRVVILQARCPSCRKPIASDIEGQHNFGIRNMPRSAHSSRAHNLLIFKLVTVDRSHDEFGPKPSTLLSYLRHEQFSMPQCSDIVVWVTGKEGVSE